MTEPILCHDCGHDIDQHDLGECCDCPGAGRGCHQWVSDIVRTYAEERVREALEAEPTDAEVEAAGYALNVEGWTCRGGAHEPGNYDDCEGCQLVCDDMARAALTAARDARKASHD